MNDKDLLLQAQSYLDGELSAQDRAAMEAKLRDDSELRAVWDELRATKSLLAENEPAHAAPVSREFYWSRIQREIYENEATSPAPPSSSSLLRWLKMLAPFGAAALIILGGFTLLAPEPQEREKSAYYQEIETPLEDTTVISFVSHTEGMTIVWLGSGR